MSIVNTVVAPTSPVSYAKLNRTLTGNVIVAVAASMFIALAAHVSFPLPFTPVPLTLGNMAVVMVGLVLSPASAFAAVTLYLAEGATGLPVFNPGGLGGVAQLLGPTGGYLFAYPFAALSVSILARTLSRRLPRFATSTIAAFVGTAIVLLCGVTWLGTLLHLAPLTALRLATLPFLPGEMVKIAAAAGIYSSIQSWRKA